MATYTKIGDWAYNLHTTGQNLDTDQIELALTNTAYASESPNPTTDSGAGTNGVLGSLTQLDAGAYTNYSDDLAVDRNLTIANLSTTSSGGTFTLDFTLDIVITASGGAMSTFQYVYIWDDNVTSPADPLISTWDHGSGITLASTDSATLQFNASGIYTLA
jgi:hypothetical protein